MQDTYDILPCGMRHPRESHGMSTPFPHPCWDSRQVLEAPETLVLIYAYFQTRQRLAVCTRSHHHRGPVIGDSFQVIDRG